MEQLQLQLMQENERDKDLALLVVADALAVLAVRLQELSLCLRKLSNSQICFFNHHCSIDSGGLFYDLQIS